MCNRDPLALIDHYAGGIAELTALTDEQRQAVRVAMALAIKEVDDKYTVVFARQHDQIADLNNELLRRTAAERTAYGLAAEIVKGVSRVGVAAPDTVSVNGTHPPAAVHAVASADDAPAVTEAQPDPTTQATTAAPKARKPAEFRWETLDDVSLEIARNLDEGRIPWRTISADDKKIIVLATIGELQLNLAPGESLAIEQFDQRRPIWMPSFPSLSTSIGMTWKQMTHAASS